MTVALTIILTLTVVTGAALLLTLLEASRRHVVCLRLDEDLHRSAALEPRHARRR